jgi:hypothetical protein
MNKSLKDDNGDGTLLVFVIGVVVVIFGLSLAFLISYQAKSNAQSKKSTRAFYMADAGVERSIYEFNQSTGPYTFGGTEIFLPDNINPEGSFVITYSSSPVIPDTWVVNSTGYIPKAVNPQAIRRIEAVCQKPASPITVNGALAAGGNVTVGGNASVDGGTLAGVLVPPGYTATTQGSGDIDGTPPTSTAPFPTFQAIFGISFAEMENIAEIKYNLPANNAPADGITWCNGDFMVTTNSWTGEGILIVNGNFKMTGGHFNGVIYVKGTFDMAGNAEVLGAAFSENTANIELTTGHSQLTYDASAESLAESLYPFKVISWKEIL